jgi:hypothetical protein
MRPPSSPPVCPGCDRPTVARPVRGVIRWACLTPDCPIVDMGPALPGDPARRAPEAPEDRRGEFLERKNAPNSRRVREALVRTLSGGDDASGREPEPPARGIFCTDGRAVIRTPPGREPDRSPWRQGANEPFLPGGRSPKK